MRAKERLGEDVYIKNCFGLISYYFDHLHICSSSSTTRQTNTLYSHKYFSFILFMLLLLPLCFVSCLSCVYVLNCHMIEITCMKIGAMYAIRYREKVHIFFENFFLRALELVSFQRKFLNSLILSSCFFISYKK